MFFSLTLINFPTDILTAKLHHFALIHDLHDVVLNHFSRMSIIYVVLWFGYYGLMLESLSAFHTCGIYSAKCHLQKTVQTFSQLAHFFPAGQYYSERFRNKRCKDITAESKLKVFDNY